jgi:PAS domain S-box-containing protein
MKSVSSVLSLEVILERISEITLQIQQGRELGDILSGAIAQIRSLLQTDRILIYRLLPDQDAVVAFESVDPEWTPILGQMFYDPCITAIWVERYRQGQATAISDTHDESIDPCYIKLLDQLQVRANLVVPIFNQGTLWFLLVAHHRHPRQWQPLEIQLLRQIALQLGIAVQQAELRQVVSMNISERKQKEELIQNIAQGVSAKTGEAFFHSLVQYLIRLLGMDQAFVGELIASENPRVRIIAGLGNGQLLDGLEYPLAGTLCEQVIRQGFCIYPDQIQQHFSNDSVLQTLECEGYAGISLVSSSGTVIGLIGVLCNQAIAHTQFIQEVLTIFAMRAASELERQQSETLLRRYERIVSATPDCVSLIDRNYCYQVINQTYLDWNQKSYDEIIGHSVSDLLGQEFFENAAKPSLDRCLSEETQHVVEAWLNYPDGQRRYVKVAYAPYAELDGSISGVVVNVHDLTKLKQTELENQSLRERLNSSWRPALS